MNWALLLSTLLVSTLCLSAVAQQPSSKQWLHNNCKAYEKDYAPLVTRYLSRYASGIHVSTVLELKPPQGRSHEMMEGARPVIYIVNNTLHYADRQMSLRQAQGMFSAGFTVYFMPVIERCVAFCDPRSAMHHVRPMYLPQQSTRTCHSLALL